ncbi:MAG: hypothetical protein U9P44_02510 [archaeon]|nr:hypothetical protein [archaeon]
MQKALEGLQFNVEDIQLPFGDGARFNNNRSSYEQVSCNDGFLVRVYKDNNPPHNSKDMVPDESYRGIIHSSQFKETIEGYRLFKNITNRLSQVSDKAIKNSKHDFKKWLEFGFEEEQELSGTKIKYVLEDDDLPSSYLKDDVRLCTNKDSMNYGRASTFLIYAGIVTAMGITFGWLPAGCVAVAAPVIEYKSNNFITALISIFPHLVLKKKYMDNVKDSNYYLNRFYKKYKDQSTLNSKRLSTIEKTKKQIDTLSAKKIETVKDQIKNKKRLDQSKKDLSESKKEYKSFYADFLLNLNDEFALIKDVFEYTTRQKGFSIEYKNYNRDNVVELFTYLLEGGDMPEQLALKKAEYIENQLEDIENNVDRVLNVLETIK